MARWPNKSRDPVIIQRYSEVADFGETNLQQPTAKIKTGEYGIYCRVQYGEGGARSGVVSRLASGFTSARPRASANSGSIRVSLWPRIAECERLSYGESSNCKSL
jgi:hypothetical protein